MTCGGCVASVERALSGVAGVAAARVNLTTGIATVDVQDPSVPRAALVQAVRAAGYEADTFRQDDAGQPGWERTQDTRVREHKQAVAQAIGLTIPIMGVHLVAPFVQGTGHEGHVWPHALQGLLTVVLLWSSAGAPILLSGWRALLRGVPNMDALVGLGVTVATLAGIYSVVTGAVDQGNFHAAAMILAFINVGKYLEARARRESTSAVGALARRMPQKANLVAGDTVTEVPLGHVQIGDRVRVSPEQVVPVDGTIVSGEAAIDESALTGEAVPRFRRMGEAAAAGTLVVEGVITIEAVRIGAESSVARIMRAVEDAQSGKTNMQRIADRVAGVFVPIAIVLALLTLFINAFGFGTGWMVALERGIAVLVIACPCAMGLATPTAVVVATGAAALRGILVRDAATLEAAGQVNEVLFDKTGTLTSGTPQVAAVELVGQADASWDREKVLASAAALEQHSQHPYARAIVEEAKRSGMTLREPENYQSVTGQGVIGVVDGQPMVVGSASMLAALGIDISAMQDVKEKSVNTGHSLVCVAAGGKVVAAILLADALRDSAKSAIAELKELGVRTAVLSGDHRAAVQSAAREAGIDDFRGEMSPQQKLDEVTRRRARGRRVAFVGDGVNDGPALAAADVGMTLSSATDVAIGAAPITLLGNDLRQVPEAVRIARRSVRIIRQNLGWAFLYNVAAIPLAAAGKISPGWAAAMMMASSISVVLNSLRLRKWKKSHEATEPRSHEGKERAPQRH